MLKLLPNEAPYRYIFPDPDTGHIHRGRSREELIKWIVRYREQNRLPEIEGLIEVLENYWCSLPENVGKCTKLKLRRGWASYMKGGVALLKNYFLGEKNMVDQATADARGAICETCPQNIFPDKGPFIAWSDEIAEMTTGGRKAANHDKLGNCGVCSCPLRAKVFMKHPKPFTAKEQKLAPDICWMKGIK